MQLQQLSFTGVRNLEAANLYFGPHFNIISGINGSGKTSLLEAIYILSHGRSFRSATISPVINLDSYNCVVSGKILNPCEEVENIWLGVEKSRQGVVQYKIAQEKQRSAADLAKLLPLQLLNVASHSLLEGAPQNRRQFIDWGAFHVEPEFITSWRIFKRALEQRNALLKRNRGSFNGSELEMWSHVLVQQALKIDSARQNYLHSLHSVVISLVAEFMNLQDFGFRYLRGWEENQELQVSLGLCQRADFNCGYTTKGPHRAELEITVDNVPAKSILSRGQIKLLVCILYLSRAYLLQNKYNRKSIFLIDDVHAELDSYACKTLLDAVAALKCQAFVTMIESQSAMKLFNDKDVLSFHMEQGKTINGKRNNE